MINFCGNKSSGFECDMGSTGKCILGILGGLVLISLFTLFLAMTLKTSKQTSVIGKPEPVRDTITMNGRGEIIAIPDVAVMEGGLETTAKTVAEAQTINTKSMNGFLAKVKSLGVDEKDRKTINYSIQPKYEYKKETEKDLVEKQILVGYSINNTIQIKVRKLDSLSDILSAMGQFGLNQVGSLSFTIDNDRDLKRQALEKALADAQERATAFAHATKAHVGKIVSFSEGGYVSPYNSLPMYGDAYRSLTSAEAAPGMPVTEKGSQEITATVNVTFELLY